MKNITISTFLEAHKQHGSSIMQEVALSMSQVCIRWTITQLQKSNFAAKNKETIIEEARYIFDEAILLTFENTAKGKIQAPEKDVKLSTYVITICRNLLYKKGFIMEPLDDDITDFEADYELSIAQKEKLKKCKEELSAKARALVDLVLDGVPHVRIAELLGYKNEGVSRSSYSQALTSIRNCLGPNFFE